MQDEFAAYDWGRGHVLKDINSRLDLVCNLTARDQVDSTSSPVNRNPQDPSQTSKMIAEAELEYFIDLLKSKTFQHKVLSMKELHHRASWTAKVLTTEMVEGKISICQLIDQYSNVDNESVRTLLTRC